MAEDQYLIVDGHSVIFAIDDLADLHRRRTVLAREELARRLTAYQDATGTRVVLVFDGRGERVTGEAAAGGIQIFYSREGMTADDVIERLAARYAGERDVTVATGDRMEQETVSAFGASVWPIRRLVAELEGAEREVRDWLRRSKRR